MNLYEVFNEWIKIIFFKKENKLEATDLKKIEKNQRNLAEVCFIFVCFGFGFETEFHPVAQNSLELTL